jgi:lipase maturation factor 1
MRAVNWLVGPEEKNHFLARWIFLRALGLIYFSAFYSLLFQIKGLIGPQGILPAGDYLPAVAEHFPGWQRFWFAPTWLWWSSSNGMLMLVCWVGLAASVAVILNLWPRAGLFFCFVCFLSFVGAAQEFAGYQSDGMLLEAGFISLFFAPAGLRPRLGTVHPPSRLSLFLLRWEWFRIYFESGIVKVASGDYSWRHLTAMDDYYQNGPLPTWIGWHVQHLPHGFHAVTAFMALAAELGLVFMLFLPRRFKIICFFILTPFQIVIILTANYTFLNYLVLVLGFLLLDDDFLRRVLPRRWTEAMVVAPTTEPVHEAPLPAAATIAVRLKPVRRAVTAVSLGWVFYVTTALLLATLATLSRNLDAAPWEKSVLWKPVAAVEPFRIANGYGLFAVMTHERYEIEFQGTQDGENWIAYPFRYKPQALATAPGIYAPYQPRFEWNLWFASLGSWRRNSWVLNAEAQLLRNEPNVLALFASNPFPKDPPRQVRAVLWQYWFTDRATRSREGNWWRRQMVRPYAPALELRPDGKIHVAESDRRFLEADTTDR